MKQILGYGLCLLTAFVLEAREMPEHCPSAASVKAMLAKLTFETMQEVVAPYEWVSASGFIYRDPGTYRYDGVENSLETNFAWKPLVDHLYAFSIQEAILQVMNKRDSLVSNGETPKCSLGYRPVCMCEYDAGWRLILYSYFHW